VPSKTFVPATTKSDLMKRWTNSPQLAGTAHPYAPILRGWSPRSTRPGTNGEIKWNGGRVYLSEALCGEPVGRTRQDDRYWTIHFGPLKIGLLDNYANRASHTPTLVLPMSPVYL
jgi:hypothetical protein